MFQSLEKKYANMFYLVCRSEGIEITMNCHEKASEVGLAAELGKPIKSSKVSESMPNRRQSVPRSPA